MTSEFINTVNDQTEKRIKTIKQAPMPWQDRLSGCSDIVWRYHDNPVIPRDAIPTSNSVFNSAVIRFGEGFAGVFRCDDKIRNMQIHAGISKDGINWTIEPERIKFKYNDEDISKWEFGYDPRVCLIEGRYYVTWCNGYHGPTIGIGYTCDFKNFTMIENALLPFNRNGVLFPRKINGEYAMLSRPSDNGHTPFGDIFYSQSPNMIHWGKHRHVMSPTTGWQMTKIGAGPIPIETKEGWLLFYHGVLTSCNGFVYSMGAALLDLEKPWKVIYRNSSYLLSPQKDYECVGDVPNVVFPCAALYDEPTGRIAIYYGGADTVTCLAFCKCGEVLDFLKSDNCVV